MGLSRDQADMIGRMKSREAVCYCPALYPRAIHGTIPMVPDPIGGDENV